VNKFFVQSFGCRASQADGAALEVLLSQQGMALVQTRSEAELVVLNSCTVTASADSDLRQTARRVRLENPSAKLLVTGCYAQRAPDEIAALPGVEWVIGNSHKLQIPQILTGDTYHGGIHAGMIGADILTVPATHAGADRARPNLKIQDGCHNRCSFCIIPSVRGGNRFVDAGEVVSQVAALAVEYREVVLTGINLGRWGRRALSDVRLHDLLRRILNETEIARVRLSSVEPMDFSDELLQLISETPRIAQHVHAPLQSGSDTILRAMHRKYRTRHYEARTQLARRLMPHAAIGADVMVGFPGETDALFEESRSFIASIPFTYLHVFTYSERPGTAAATLPGAVPMHVRRERNRILRELGEQKHLEFRRSQLGRTVEVVTLETPGRGITSNHLHMELADWKRANELQQCVVGGVTASGVREERALQVL
jgi:threonylcarbamoyladenosine tRNA methylthiotransferase MtaB